MSTWPCHLTLAELRSCMFTHVWVCLRQQHHVFLTGIVTYFSLLPVCFFFTHYSQSYGFSSSHVWMWELDHKESWMAKNWCFWTVVLKKTLESPLEYRRSNQSILKEISPEYSLEGLMLKLQYFGHLMQRADSLEETLVLGNIEAKGEEGGRGWDG